MSMIESMIEICKHRVTPVLDLQAALRLCDSTFRSLFHFSFPKNIKKQIFN